MKLSQQTIDLLSNFVTVNTSILIRETPAGATETKLATLHKERKVYAEVNVPEVFDKQLSYYDFPKVLSMLRLADDPELELSETYANVLDGTKRSNRLIYASPETFTHPTKNYTDREEIGSIELEEVDLGKVLKAANILGLEGVRFIDENGTFYIEAFDPAVVSGANNYKVNLGPTPQGLQGSYPLETSVLTMLAGDYEVAFTDLAVVFKHKGIPSLKYVVAIKA